MIVDAITQVKDSEKTASQILQEASKKAEIIRDEAEAEADEKILKITQEAKAERDKILKEAKKQGQLTCEPIFAQCAQEIEKIKGIDQKKINQLVSSIVERIVMKDGDS